MLRVRFKNLLSKTEKRTINLADIADVKIFSNEITGTTSFRKPVVWHGSDAMQRMLFNEKFTRYEALNAYYKRLIFPPTRDKDKSKRNYNFSSYYKLWQREYTKIFFNDLTVQFNWLYNKLNNMGRGYRVRNMQLRSNIIDYRESFWTFWHRSILGFVFGCFCFDIKIAFGLIKHGFVFINGIVAMDPFLMVHKLSIVKIDIPSFFFVVFGMLVWKLRKSKLKSFVKKTLLSRFSPATNLETSFKLGEYFVLPLQYMDLENSRSFLTSHFQLALLFSQRFFPKQKGFGFGRLI